MCARLLLKDVAFTADQVLWPLEFKGKMKEVERSGQMEELREAPAKNRTNKPAMNNRRLLIAAVFYFVHPVEKGS